MPNVTTEVEQLNQLSAEFATGHADLRKLSELAASLGVPTRARRDDPYVFIDTPEKISTATWRQCGGVLFALIHDAPANSVEVAALVAQRLAGLAPSRGEPRH